MLFANRTHNLDTKKDKQGVSKLAAGFIVHQGNSLQDLANSCEMICKQMRNTIFDLKNLSSAVALQKTPRRISTVNVSSSSRPDRQKEKDDTAIIMVIICYYMIIYDLHMVMIWLLME